MNFIPTLCSYVFPSRIIAVFVVWTAGVFSATANYCLLFLLNDLPQWPFILAILIFPILALGLMIAMIRNPMIDRIVSIGLLFEWILLLFFSSQLVVN